MTLASPLACYGLSFGLGLIAGAVLCGPITTTPMWMPVLATASFIAGCVLGMVVAV